MSSSRRGTGEIHILAMLDGQAPGRRLRALPAVVWYGAAGVLACGLLLALGWLVRGPTPAPTPDADKAGAVQASAQPTQPARAVPAAPDTYVAPAAPARGAVIIDLPPPAPALAASAEPVHAPAGTGTVQTPSRHPLTHPTTPVVPSARPQPASRTTSTQALAHADPAAPRQKRSGGTSRTTPPSVAVDTDVALISAILQHTGTRNEAADGAGTTACADKSCGPRMPSRQ
jgi:hypothetical protein